jgi:hypothetical protein
LQRLGFKTFNSFWSEDYDNYSEAGRIRKIELLLEEVVKFNANQTLLEMQDILDHNFTVFKSLTYDKIRRTFGQ